MSRAEENKSARSSSGPIHVGADGAVTVLWLLISDLTERSCDRTRRKKGKGKGKSHSSDFTGSWRLSGLRQQVKFELFNPLPGSRFWSNRFPQDPQARTHSPIWVLYSPSHLETSNVKHPEEPEPPRLGLLKTAASLKIN
ncbi:unnamed protein product [Pleuronectes platessa]|uniref:Uncharacterized protein n=1 Tax=Pleuronectes platessa TaxID=8262 RepID=A0A9N7TLT3_PLEPL|nr:unnamed protein product [Pleuronectes platessa]